MIAYKHIKQAVSVVLLLFVLKLASQEEKKWQSLPTPYFSDLYKIQFLSNDSALVSGKQLFWVTPGGCKKFREQPPCEIAVMFAVNTKNIFVSNNTPYQNSEIFHWNGKKWQKIKNPMANNINDMYFSDEKNGYILSYGEIVQLKNNRWIPMNPPTNRTLHKIYVNANNEPVVLSTPVKGLYKYTNRWVTIKNSPNALQLSKSNDNIYVLGYDYLGLLQADSLHILSKNTIWSKINAVAEAPDHSIIGVGKKGMIIRFSNGKIIPMECPVTQDLQQIINHNNQLWIVGKDGSLLTYTQKKLQTPENIWKGFETITFNKTAKVTDDEYGVIAADFNNDGWTDVFTCGLFEQEHLYINQKNNRFIDRAVAFKLNEKNTRTKELNLGACAGDIDNDGYIDLYLSVLNGKNKIYKNINGKYFVDYSQNTGGTGQENDRTNACIMGDVDNDGDLDIFIANEFSSNRMFLNNGVGVFTEITETAHLSTPEGGNAAGFGDIDNDGDIDLYVTTWSSQNILYKNLFKETGKVQFQNITQSSHTGGETYAKSNAVVFSDMDNDGDLDLFVTNRKTSNRLYINDGSGHFTDKTQALIGFDTDNSYGAVIADFDGDFFKDIYVSNVGKNVFYKNERGVLIRETEKYTAPMKGYSTGSAWADFDNDGDLDLYIANYLGASSALMRNKKQDAAYIKLQVEGIRNNRNAIGSKIYVFDSDSRQIFFDEIRAGSGYMSENELYKTIPVPENQKVSVKIVFPDASVKIRNSVSNGSNLSISDVEGTEKILLKWRQNIKSWFLDPHKLFELIKWIFIILLIGITGYRQQIKHRWNPVYTVSGSLLFVIFYYIQYTYFQYAPFLYATLLPLSSVVVAILLTYYYFERKHIKNISEWEKNQIKTRFSRDLHDDLAATVSSIGFYLSLIRIQTKEKDTKISSFIQKAEDLLQDAANAITDLIWSVHPKPETLASLLQRIQKNYQPLFQAKNIRFAILPQQLPRRKLSDTEKQHIYLIIKEALNNILKYAEATEVLISIEDSGTNTQIRITDNGKGFDFVASQNRGNGLRNMQKRAIEIPAKIQIYSKKGNGTHIKLIFKK